jgi:hypothetical protein
LCICSPGHGPTAPPVASCHRWSFEKSWPRPCPCRVSTSYATAAVEHRIAHCEPRSFPRHASRVERRARRDGLSHACAPVKCHLKLSSPRFPKRPSQGLRAREPLRLPPPPERPVQPYYAALGLAARGCGRQPLSTEVAAIAARSRHGSVRPEGQSKKGFWISYTTLVERDLSHFERPYPLIVSIAPMASSNTTPQIAPNYCARRPAACRTPWAK